MARTSTTIATSAAPATARATVPVATARRSDGVRLTLLLGLLAALPPLSIDISIPAVLAIQRELGASVRVVGLTITMFMAGFAAGQFAAGPLSDRFGRRPVLLMALSAYALAGAGCALTGSGAQLVAWRLAQGVAAGACAVLAFAIVRDLYEGDAARSKRSYITVIFGLAPMLAPALGVAILGAAGWRPIFLLLSASGLTLLAVVAATLPETGPARPGRPGLAFAAAYVEILSNRGFLALAAVNALSYAGMFAYIAGSSEVLMGSLGLSARGYAAFFACTAASLTAGAWTSARCVAAGIGPGPLMWAGLATAAASAATLSLAVGSGWSSFAILAPLLMLSLFCRGLVAPTAQHLALDPLKHLAGTAAAAVGVVQIVSGAASSAAVALLLPGFGPLGMAGTMAGLAAAALALWAWLALRPATALG